MFGVLKAKLLLCIVKKCYFCSQYQYTVKEYQDLANQPTEFYYDPNGNLIADLDRNIVSIRYNVLNLPDTIQFSNGNQISNRYTADGIKRMSTYITSVFDVAIPLGSVCQWYRYSRQVYQSNGTIYCGNAEYEIIPTGGASLQRIDFGNGYIRNNTYYYTITDYLGNISSVWNGTSNVVEQQTTYYPSGLPHRTSTNANLQRYKYNGKELITNHGYDQYDYHARGYYPAIMRFTSVDPLAEKYTSISPYAYCANNPIMFIDPDGRDPIYAKNFWGKVKTIGDDGQNSTGSYLVRGSVARDVKAATKVGEFYTGSLAESKNVMHVPTGQKLEGVKQSFTDTQLSQKENGGHSNIGDATVTRWDEGPAAVAFTDKYGNQGAQAKLQMFVVNGQNTMPADASNVEMWWHTHPNTTVNGVSLGSSNPSDDDYSGQKAMTNRNYKGNTFVIGVRSETVTFFNKDRALHTVKWSDFLRMGGQEK